jgi:hypothetical protein
MGPVHDETIGPDVIPVGWPQTDTGTVIEPESAPLGLLARDLQPLPAPDALHSLVIHRPARPAEPLGQADDNPSQHLLIVPDPGPVTLSRPGLINDLTEPPLRYTHLGLEMSNTATTPLGAQ